MPASMQSATTRGFGLAGGFAGTAALVVALGYGIGAQIDPEPDLGRIIDVAARDRSVIVVPARDRSIITVPARG